MRIRPRRCHTLVEIRRDRCMPVVHLSGEPLHHPNQSSAPPVIDYNRLTPGEAKETHPLSVYWSIKNEKLNLIHTIMDLAKPDIILGNESWLTPGPDIKNSESFSDSFAWFIRLWSMRHGSGTHIQIPTSRSLR